VPSFGATPVNSADRRTLSSARVAALPQASPPSPRT
jgi:hypothetical protein